MLYAALTFWLLVIVFCAAGVHRLWSALSTPRAVNLVLLPGTLVAQLGHVLGLLVTGNSVKNVKLIGDDPAGAPKSDPPPEPRVPVIGPIVVGLLPLLACGGGLYAAAHYLGGPIVGDFAPVGVPDELPLSLAAGWGLLRQCITLAEKLLDAILDSRLLHWSTLLFLYLAICLTVRMAPFPGNRRGAVGAIVLAGVTVAVIGTLSVSVRDCVYSSWLILSFAVAMLLLLLLLSLAAAGLVALVRILAGRE